MAGQIGYETARRIAEVWGEAESLEDAMIRAGLKGSNLRNMNRYRRQAEELLGIRLPPINPRNASYLLPRNTEHFHSDEPYVVVIYSDAHFWPGSQSPAFWILLDVLYDLKPKVVVNNGDALDGAQISRHDPNGWEVKPSLRQELDACIDCNGMIEEAAGDAVKFWQMGNHDFRLENYLAKHAPAFEAMPGTTLADYFKSWTFSWSLMLNGHVFIKHAWHSGIHGAYNNTLKSGKTMVTGHTHRLICTPWTDLNGTRYGIETGMLNHPFAPQFDYCQDTPRNWRPGFVVLTVDGDNVYPELVEVKGDRAFFRGKYYTA